MLEVILLAVVQGVAEFLPISSSGHLVLASQFLGDGRADAGLNILLHAGTLGSILVHYRDDVLSLLRRQRRLVPLLALGTLPAVAAGILAKVWFEELLESPVLAACMLLFTGGLLLSSRFFRPRGRDLQQLTPADALVTGTAQAFALLPGVSRSGATIVAALGRGLEHRAATTWAFLLAIPAILGASVVELSSVVGGGDSQLTAAQALAGLLLSFGVGLLALKLVVRVVEAGRLWWFAPWCFLVGLGYLLSRV